VDTGAWAVRQIPVARSFPGLGSWCSLVSTLDCQASPGLSHGPKPAYNYRRLYASRLEASLALFGSVGNMNGLWRR